MMRNAAAYPHRQDVASIDGYDDLFETVARA